MKHPEDTKTIDMMPAPKRGRGRPPKADAMTPAERTRAYRARLAESGRPIATKNVTDNYGARSMMIQEMEKEMRHHMQRRDDMHAELEKMRAELERARDLVQSLRTETAEAKTRHLDVLTRLTALDPTGKKEAAAKKTTAKKEDLTVTVLNAEQYEQNAAPRVQPQPRRPSR